MCVCMFILYINRRSNDIMFLCVYIIMILTINITNVVVHQERTDPLHNIVFCVNILIVLHYNIICVTMLLFFTMCFVLTFYLCVCDRLILWHAKNGLTPLLKAAYGGHMDAVRFLATEAKADPHQRNQVGKAYIHRVRAFIIDNSDNSDNNWSWLN